MNKKRNDLEAIVDLMREWAEEYGEPYVTACVLYDSEEVLYGMADILLGRPDHDEVSVCKKYETPAAGTARESR